MDFIQILGFFVVLLLLGGSAFVIIAGVRTKGSLQRALNMGLFLIQVPREHPKDGQPTQQQQMRELISVGEQLLASLANAHATGWNKLLYGEPYVALELAVHHIGEETHMYMAVPRALNDVIEKQIHSYYPTAEVAKIHDYNIFNPTGAVSGACVKYTKEQILPFRTYQKLESDPLSALLTSLSKLNAEGEGAAIQIIARPTKAKKLKEFGHKVAREMQGGYNYIDAWHRAKHPPKKKKVQEYDQNLEYKDRSKTVSPTDEEIIKGITEKTGKQNFDVNIRLLASAPTQLRADQLLHEIEGSFAQYRHATMNSLQVIKVAGRKLQKLVYNFAFRLFDSGQKLTCSTEEITSLYHIPIITTAVPKLKYLKSKM